MKEDRNLFRNERQSAKFKLFPTSLFPILEPQDKEIGENCVC